MNGAEKERQQGLLIEARLRAELERSIGYGREQRTQIIDLEAKLAKVREALVAVHGTHGSLTEIDRIRRALAVIKEKP